MSATASSKSVWRETIDGRTIEYRLVPVGLLSTDGYQREQSNAAVKRIVNGFDCRLYDPPLVALMPDGTYQVIDGGHRKGGWEDLFGAGRVPERVMCRVAEVKNRADAADLFIKVNLQRRNLVPYDYWRAGCIRGDKDALDMRQAAIDFGMPIAKRKRFKSGATLTCVAHLKRIWKTTGDDSLLRETLEVLTSAWPDKTFSGDQYRAHGFLIEGLAEAILEAETDPSRKWNKAQAINRLSKHSPADIRAEALNRAAGVTKATNNPEVFKWVIRNVLVTGKVR